MGVIRGGLLSIVVIVLFISFLTTSILLTFDLSLSYNHVKPELLSLVKDLSGEAFNVNEIVDEELGFMEEYCKNNTEYMFSEQGETFTIPCSVVSEGVDSIIESTAGNYVEKAYYKKYNCDFWNCLSKTGSPFFLVSQKARDYWHGKFYVSFVFSLVLIALVFLLVGHKPNFMIITGILLALSSLLFRKISWWILALADKAFLQFFSIFFSQENSVFLVGLIIGLVVLVLGIIFKFLRWDHEKKKFSKRDVQEMVKKEVSSSKKKK